MKKFVSAITMTMVVFLCAMLMCAMATDDYSINDENLYQMIAVVEEVHDNYVVVVDGNGEAWAFNDLDEWYVGDVVRLTMNTMGNDFIRDDEIVYADWIGITEM